MLLEKPISSGDTVSLKLNAGEEIIARYDSEDSDVVTLHKPMALIAQGQGLGLAPFMFSVDPDHSKFKIKANAIVCIARTEEGLAKQYTEKTTGIVT
mgnify:FL=1|jgi:hypothetical protein